MDKRDLVRAIEYGIALGLIIGIAVVVPSDGADDFTLVFWPAGRVAEPYGDYGGMGFFAYPVWNVYLLRVLSLFPLGVGLICIYVASVVAVLALAPRWGTPAWLVMLSPVFLIGVLYAQPFEALVFVGLTLIVVGWPRSELLVGLGLCLLAFKPQIGFVPALFVGLRRPRAVLLPAAMALAITGVDFAVSGRLWIIPWWHVLRHMPGVHWNDSLWGGLGVFSLMWVPVGLWLLKSVWGDIRKELWVVTALGMLCMPYWSSVSLWPLVAMMGGLVGSDANSKV